MLLTSSDTEHTMMHLFLFTKSAQKRTGFNMYAEYTRLQLTFLALHPCEDHILGNFLTKKAFHSYPRAIRGDTGKKLNKTAFYYNSEVLLS